MHESACCSLKKVATKNTKKYFVPIGDEVYHKELKQPAKYLLGRKTFEIWECTWPGHVDFWPGINEGKKYIKSNTRENS